MNQKDAYYPPLLMQNPSVAEEDIAAAKKAHEIFAHYKKEKIIVMYENNPIELKTLLGKGGSKLVFDLHNGHAVAFFNTQPNPTAIQMRNRLIKEEVAVSQKLRQLGLCTQAYEKATLYFDGSPIPVLKMPTFDSLVTQGQQVRDIRNSHHYGTSLLFENLSNLQSPKHWQKVLQGIQEDLAIYYSQNLAFGSDSFNLAVVDSDETPIHDRTALTLFTEHKQKVRFYFYDFSSRDSEYKEIKYNFLNSEGQFDRKCIEEKIDSLFTRVVDIISIGLLPIEYINFFGGIHTLQLVSEDAIVKEIPEKTIVLKKMGTGMHYAYFVDQNGVFKEKEIGKIDFDRSKSLAKVLSKLSEKFPSSGETEKKIMINEHKKIVEKIAFKCGFDQHSEFSCVLNIKKLAKTALEEVKPLFIKAVTDEVIEKLTQPAPEEDFDNEQIICTIL